MIFQYLGQCQMGSTLSYKYLCNGTQVNLINYDTNDCSGNPDTTQNNICNIYTDCTATCDKTNCTGITSTTYSTDDCSGDIQVKVNYLPGICIGSATLSQKVTCIGGQVQLNIYSGSADCSNTPTLSQTINPGTCNKGNDDSTSIKFEGCDSSTTTFTLFGAVITVFITSLF